MQSKALSFLKFAPPFLALISAVIRYFSIPSINHDLKIFNLVWYKTLYQQGIASALATEFANYTPPYTYLLALATFTRQWISPLTAIKLIPTVFDLLGAILVYKIIKLKYQNPRVPLLAASIYFSAPTIMVNSSYWGQADSLYTFFLLACVYFVLTEKSFWAAAMLGVSFSFKAQAIFLGPFLFILALRKKINWLFFGMIPLIYLLAVLPVVMLGRPILNTLLIYTKQSDTFESLTMNAPNLYYLLPREWLGVIFPLGILVTLFAMLYWSVFTAKSPMPLSRENLLLLAFLSAALSPYLLPKMHDRYFYPADALSILLAFYMPSLWFLPVIYQIISFTAISGFLFNIHPQAISMAAVLNSLAITFMLKQQIKIAGLENKATPRQIKMIEWSGALLLPAVLWGFAIGFLLSPYHIRAAYSLPPAIAAQSTLTKSERFQWMESVKKNGLK